MSHERIFCSLFIQARGVLKKELLGHLRSKRRIRRSQHLRIFKDSRGRIVDAISIRERPAEIEDRAVPGHWEGDLIGGTKNSHIATLVERHSRFTALVRVRSKDAATVVAALSRQIRRLPTSQRRSLTWDRGLEMAKHKTFTIATNVNHLRGGADTFKYDPFGRRIYKSSSAGTSIFAYDGDNLIEETNSSGAVVARYAQTENIDEPLAMLRSSTTSYYQADGLGSVTSMSNAAGTLAQTYTFDSSRKATASRALSDDIRDDRTGELTRTGHRI